MCEDLSKNGYFLPKEHACNPNEPTHDFVEFHLKQHSYVTIHYYNHLCSTLTEHTSGEVLRLSLIGKQTRNQSCLFMYKPIFNGIF